MKWLILIPAGLIVLLLAVFWLPVCVRVRWNSRLTVWAGVGKPLFQVYETPEEPPAEEEKPPEEKPKKSGKKKSPRSKKLTRGELWDLVMAVPAPLRVLLRRIRIHHTAVRILTVGEDAAEAAIRAGHTGAAVYGAWAVLGQFFTVEPPEILVLPDFFRTEDNVYFESRVTIRPAAVLAFLAGFLNRYRQRRQQRNEPIPAGVDSGAEDKGN